MVKVDDPSAVLRGSLERIVGPAVYRLLLDVDDVRHKLDKSLLDGDLNVSARHHTHGIDEHERSTGKYWPTAPSVGLAKQRARWVATDLRSLADQCDNLVEVIAAAETAAAAEAAQ